MERRLISKIAACAIVMGSLLGTTSAWAVNIAFFNDGSFVDTSLEAPNMRADLVTLGHTVTNFTGTSDVTWASVFATADVIVVPELEVGDLSGALSTTTKSALSAFVSLGGGFIDVFSNTATFQSRAAALINDITGVVLTPTGGTLTGGSSSINAANTAGTAFAGGPAIVSHPSGTGGVTTASTPAGTSMYTSGSNTTVYAASFGAGNVVGLGFDWFAAPAQWTAVLGNAVNFAATPSVPEPATLALMTAGLAGIGFRRKRKQKVA